MIQKYAIDVNSPEDDINRCEMRIDVTEPIQQTSATNYVSNEETHPLTFVKIRISINPRYSIV